MAVLGWHRVRVPGGLTPEGLAIAQDVARSIKGHGASQVFVVKVCDDTIQFLDLWPDRATFERFTDWAMVAMALDEPKHWDLMGGEYVQGGDGNGEVIFAML
jgi:hypothetical protein